MVYRKIKFSPDERFKVINSTPPSSSDHFYPDTDLEWKLIDTKTGKTLMTFDGDWSDPNNTINSVKFCKDGMEVLAKTAKGKILERFDLTKFYND